MANVNSTSYGGPGGCAIAVVTAARDLRAGPRLTFNYPNHLFRRLLVIPILTVQGFNYQSVVGYTYKYYMGL